MKHTIEMVTGDWSADGHSRTDTITIKSNLSSDNIKKAYDKGCGVIGFDLINTYCEDYEDSQLPENVYQTLKKSGFKKWDGSYEEPTEDEEGKYFVSYCEWPLLYLHIAKLGNKKLKYKVVEGNTLHIGGYGLFHG